MREEAGHSQFASAPLSIVCDKLVDCALAAKLVLEDRQADVEVGMVGAPNAVAQAIVEELLIIMSVIVTSIVVNSIVQLGHH